MARSEQETTRDRHDPNEELLESFWEEGIQEPEVSHRRENERQQKIAEYLHTLQGN